MTEHEPLPVKGYTGQSSQNIELVNLNKEAEERVLRILDNLGRVAPDDEESKRWLALARTWIQTGFMFASRAIFLPQRIKLPEDQFD